MQYFLFFIISIFMANVQAANCNNDQQPYKNYCISNKMADLIACIDISGGNKEQLVSILDNSVGSGSTNQASVSAGNKIASGSAKLNTISDKESRAIESLGAKYFSGAMHECSVFAKEISPNLKEKSIVVKEKAPQLRFPITVIASGEVVTFFPGFMMQIIMIAGDPNGLYRVQLFSQEAGKISMDTNGVPEEVTHKGVNYYISARKNEHKQVLLKIYKK